MKETREGEKLEMKVAGGGEQEATIQEESATPENVVQALLEDNVVDMEAEANVVVADELGAETKEVSHANDDNIVEVDDVPCSISNDPYLDFQAVVDFWNKSIIKGEDLWREITPIRAHIETLMEQYAPLKKKRQVIKNQIWNFKKWKGEGKVPKKIQKKSWDEKLGELEIELKNIEEEITPLLKEISSLKEQVETLEDAEFFIRLRLYDMMSPYSGE